MAAPEKKDKDDDSPYEIVRANVSNVDDTTLPSLTFRTWVLGTCFTAALAFVNQFFFFRSNPITLNGYVIQLLTFPLGVLMAKILPARRFNTFGYKWSLNPGPFNIKEHVLISIFAGTSTGVAYAIDVITIKKMWYKTDLGFGLSLLFLLSSQIMGYSFAGLSRKLLVYPAAMIWPGTLVSAALFRAFHDNRHWGKWSRMRVFWTFFAASFLWYMIPGTIFPTLSMISILCFAAPNNVIAQQLGDSQNGLGILNFTLDWSYVSSVFTGSPVATPWVMACNVFAGFVVVMWIITPAGYYSNTWGAGNMPIYTPSLFLPNGSHYDIHQIMTADQQFDASKYQAYGPLRISYHFGISYGLGFAGLMAVLTYIALHHGADIVQKVSQSKSADTDDVHARLMRSYPEVPKWWYMVTFGVTITFAIVVCETWKMLDWYWVILSVALPLVFTIPIGIIQAISNQQPALNIITEFIIGYGKPGNPIANVTFKVYGYITMVQALNLVSDQKLGHYMKIPPRHLFITQLVGTIISAFVQLGVAYWLMQSIPDICTPKNPMWSCTTATSFYSASVIWGLVGPGRMFGKDSPYHAVLYLFILGMLLPVPVWFLQKKLPNVRWLQHIHVPLLFSAISFMPPAPTHAYTNWFLFCFVSHLIHRYRNALWRRFAFPVSAGMDSGLAISSIFIYFAFEKVAFPKWWGNDDHCPLAHSGGFL
ncbi:OPT superfamily oligopeptide transporter [Martensiomyces pterosporus]|nr:OPT superfamily oligopeptide transporter [Martensiomyces pterosporus]